MDDIKRYLGLKKDVSCFDREIENMSRIAEGLSPVYVYAYFDIGVAPDGIRLFGTETVLCGSLANKRFSSCKGLIVVLATLGMESELLLKRQFALNAKNAVILDAVFTDKLEKFLDNAEKELSDKFGELTVRISCGYGDLPIQLQKPLFDVLDGNRIGVTINESFMLFPNKSVIALIGVK